MKNIENNSSFSVYMAKLSFLSPYLLGVVVERNRASTELRDSNDENSSMRFSYGSLRPDDGSGMLWKSRQSQA